MQTIDHKFKIPKEQRHKTLSWENPPLEGEKPSPTKDDSFIESSK